MFLSNTANARGEHLYQLLEVNKDATQEEIKRAYRKVALTFVSISSIILSIFYLIKFKLALKYHPDRVIFKIQIFTK